MNLSQLSGQNWTFVQGHERFSLNVPLGQSSGIRRHGGTSTASLWFGQVQSLGWRFDHVSFSLLPTLFYTAIKVQFDKSVGKISCRHVSTDISGRRIFFIENTFTDFCALENPKILVVLIRVSSISCSLVGFFSFDLDANS